MPRLQLHPLGAVGGDLLHLEVRGDALVAASPGERLVRHAAAESSGADRAAVGDDHEHHKPESMSELAARFGHALRVGLLPRVQPVPQPQTLAAGERRPVGMLQLDS